MSDEPSPQSSRILYQTEDGRTRFQCRFENETAWLRQALMAELLEIGVNTVNYHLRAIFAEGALRPEATLRDYINRPKESDFDLPGSRERQRVDGSPLAGARGYRKVQSSKDVGIIG